MVAHFFAEQLEQFFNQKRRRNDGWSGIVAKSVFLENLRPATGPVTSVNEGNRISLCTHSQG
jgi:hypothetical protein